MMKDVGPHARRDHFAIAPILLGGGERLFDDLEGVQERYECVEMIGAGAATHVRLVRTQE